MRMEQRELVSRAKAGDKEAFVALYRGVYERLYRYALYVLGRREDAEDAVAETVIAAWQQIGHLREEDAFAGWIFAILSNHCRRALRRRYEEEEDLEEWAETLPDGRDLSEAAMVRSLFAMLGDEERQIIALHLFGGYRSGEIANTLGINASTVRSKERRALRKLRQAWLGGRF